MDGSYVVTGGARGIGMAIARRLAGHGHVVVLDLPGSPEPDQPRIHLVTGDATDPEIARAAAERAERAAPLRGWVNNAAVFRDAALDTHDASEVLERITANLALAVTGCRTAVRHLLDHRRPGAIVNISSHQAQRAVRGALPYVTAKAAIEGLTRAIAVDHGAAGIRANAVALGSIGNPRLSALLDERPEVADVLAALHPLGRAGTAEEVAGVVAFLLGDDAAFLTGAVVPVDGGRAARGADPEEA